MADAGLPEDILAGVDINNFLLFVGRANHAGEELFWSKMKEKVLCSQSRKQCRSSGAKIYAHS